MSPPAPGLVGRLLDLLLPAGCLDCGAAVGSAAGLPSLSLCGACRSRLKRLAPPACPLCAVPLPAEGGAPAAVGSCRPCRDMPPAFDRLLALWRYEGPLEPVVRGLKFHRLDYLGRHLALHLAAGLGPALSALGAEVAVPVPLSWTRRLARGYNQAERIAAPLAAELGLPLAPALTRRSARAQSRLGRAARWQNLIGAFHVRSPASVRGRSVLLIDDVATTGATLHAAALALKDAGAARVSAVVAGRTPAS